jgi:hypothetical protein
LDISEKEKIFEEFLKKEIPNIIFPSLRGSYLGNLKIVSYSISKKNWQLSKSDYFYINKLKFIHFTSLDALVSILNNKCLRLSNLNKLDDPNEFLFASQSINISENHKNDAKENTFIMSMCESSIISNKNSITEFNMWRLYGANGLGVAIELDYNNNNPIEWHGFNLSKVFYGGDKIEKFNKIALFLEELNKDLPRLEVDLSQLYCFHKSELYKPEKEVRLLFDYRNLSSIKGPMIEDSNNNKLLFPVIYHDFSKPNIQNNKIKYLELPVYSAKDKLLHKSKNIAIPKISKIIFGYKLKDDYKDIIKELIKIFSEKYGYQPKFELSKLSKKYYPPF